MLYPSIDEIIKDTDSRYSLVIAVAKRARQIAQDAEENGILLKDNPVKLAINDFAEKRVAIVYRSPEELAAEDAKDASQSTIEN